MSRLLTLLGGKWQTLRDDRDVVLTRWRRSEIAPMAPANCTFANVVYDPNASLWRLFYHFTTNNTIRQTTSANGRVFSNDAAALGLGSAGAWDDTSIGVPYVWYEEGEPRPWRMIYRGAGALNESHDLGLATSLDGVTWERKDATGTVLSTWVLTGDVGQWDLAPLDHGGVIKVGNTYYLYYNTIGNPRQIGLATSTDLVTWTKHASNPLYIGTVGADIEGATADTNQGRFCPDVVRWDTPSGAIRYAMFVPHYIGAATTPEIEVYTCSSPVFLRADRSYVGTMFRTATTPLSLQNGRTISGSGTDTPRIITDDITRNVTTTARTGHEVRAAVAMNVTTTNWSTELLTWHRSLAGKLEPDGTLAGCRFVNISHDLPVAAPVIRLAPAPGDANVKGLWLPGSTGTWLDVSGSGVHVSHGFEQIGAGGALLVAASSQNVYRRPSAATDPLVTVLEACRGDFSLEVTVTFASHFTSSYRAIYGHSNNTKHHLYLYVEGGVTNYTLNLSLTSGAATKNATIAVPVAGIALDTPYQFAVCRDVTAERLYWFKDGVLLNAGGAAFAWAIDDLSALDPVVPLYIGSSSASSYYWDGHIDQIRASNICRYTANYTPAAFAPSYQASGQIFTDVYDAGSDKIGMLRLLNSQIPAGTSITVLARNATSLADQSVTAEHFTLTQPTGRYHQYLITLATTDATVSPSLTGALAQRR